MISFLLFGILGTVLGAVQPKWVLKGTDFAREPHVIGTITTLLAAAAGPTLINLASTSVGDEGVSLLAAVLQINRSITELILRGNSIGDRGAAALGPSLVDCNLELLSLGNNMIGDNGAATIARGIAANNTITRVELYGNRIGDAGAAALAAAVNDTMVDLRLGHNEIRNEGACALGAAILHPSSRLQVVDLSNNSIGDSGATGLADALSVATALTELGLECNVVGDRAISVFATSVASNNTIKTLRLGRNQFGQAARQELISAWASRQGHLGV